MVDINEESKKIAISMYRHHYLGFDDLKQAIAIGLFLFYKEHGTQPFKKEQLIKWRKIANEVRTLKRNFARFERIKRETVQAVPGITIGKRYQYITPTAERIMGTTEEGLYV